MARTLITNGYVVTVDGARNVYPGGFVSIDGARITGVGPSGEAPKADGFDEVIDAAGALVAPGLINMHQHHWYTLFKGLADGMLLEDWVSDLLLPLSLAMGPDAFRISSAIAAMEMLATGTTTSLNHSVTTTTPEIVRASIEPVAALGLRHIFGKELRCNTPGNPRHPLGLDEALAAWDEEFRRWDGSAGGRALRARNRDGSVAGRAGNLRFRTGRIRLVRVLGVAACAGDDHGGPLPTDVAGIVTNSGAPPMACPPFPPGPHNPRKS